MATLPSGGAISGGVQYEQYPSRTWRIDKETNRIDGCSDRLQSVTQAAEVILNVERFSWQIYQPYSGVRLHDLLGQEPDFVAAELQRRIREALTVDDRISGISDFSAHMEGDAMLVSFRVNSVYGDTDPIQFSL